MSNPLTVPVGELEALGAAREVTGLGVFATPTIFPSFTTFAPKPKNVEVKRTGAKQQWGQTISATGTFEAEASLEIESQPDIVGAFLAWSLGAQTTPSTTIVNTTLTAATAVGATTFPVASINLIVPGMKLTLDTSTNLETLTVESVSNGVTAGTLAVTTTTAAAFAHASGVAVTCVSTTAYLTRMTMGPLPTVSLQLNRITDGVNYLGAIVDNLSLAADPKTGLTTKLTMPYQWEEELVGGAGLVTPSFSTKEPYVFNNGGNIQQFNGVVVGQSGQVATLGLQVTLNNNIDKTYFSGASGRKVQNWVQQQRDCKFTLKMGFESAAQYQAFLGAAGATSPTTTSVAPVTFAWLLCSGAMADDTLGIPYMLLITFPKVFPAEQMVENKSTGVVEQTFSGSAAGSAGGTNDDLTIYYVGTNSTPY